MKAKTIYRYTFLFIATIIAIYETVFLWQTINWDYTKLLGIISFILSILSFAAGVSVYLMSLKYKLKRYYISFPADLDEEVKAFRINNNISADYGTDTLVPGTDATAEMRKKISRCSVCVVIICKRVSQIQKQEIHIMRTLDKKIIPIQCGNAYLPNDLSGIVPIVTEESNLKDVLIP